MTNPNHPVFHFCPKCGAPELDPGSIKSFICRACRFTFYLNCAAAVIALIHTRDRRLIVTKRKFDPFKGKLDFPGGFAEPGESIEQALKREVKEELNICITGASYLLSLPNTYVYRQVIYPITDFIFTCDAQSLESLKPGDDVDQVICIHPRDLEKNDFGLDSARQLAAMISHRGLLKNR